MKILFLTPQMFVSQESGGVIKSQQLFNFLSERHKVILGCIIKNDREASQIDSFIEEKNGIQIFSEYFSLNRNLKNLFLSLLAGKPLTVFRNFSSNFESLVNQYSKDVDMIFIDHYVMSQYIPNDYKGKVVIHQHNAEFLLWERMYKLDKNWLKKLILYAETKRIRKFEVEMCKNADSVLATSCDQDALVSVGVPRQVFSETRHVGIQDYLNEDVVNFSSTTCSLLFIGTLTWEPNIDGLKWFFKEVWPILTQTYNIEPEVDIIGRCSQDLNDLMRSVSKRIKVHGFVSELEPYYKKNRVFLAPYRFGSGVKVKVVNAFYRGVPVVTTTTGLEGLTVEPGKHVFIGDTPDSFACAVKTLLLEESIWNKVSSRSRQWAAANYSWEQERGNLQRVIEN